MLDTSIPFGFSTAHQGLTNITNSKSTDGGATWTTNCAGALRDLHRQPAGPRFER